MTLKIKEMERVGLLKVEFVDDRIPIFRISAKAMYKDDRCLSAITFCLIEQALAIDVRKTKPIYGLDSVCQRNRAFALYTLEGVIVRRRGTNLVRQAPQAGHGHFDFIARFKIDWWALANTYSGGLCKSATGEGIVIAWCTHSPSCDDISRLQRLAFR